MGKNTKSIDSGLAFSYRRAILSGILLLVIVFVFGYSDSRKIITEVAVPTEVLAENTVNEEKRQETQEWLRTNKGDYGVLVSGEDGNPVVEYDSDKKYFMASIYKLYVAYIGYQKIDQGKWDESEIYLNDWTRGKCLDEMIRTSHSPCGEKILAELGDEEIIKSLKNYGFTDTDLTDFVTSPRDVSRLLIRLQSRKDLSADSTTKILASMQAQKFRDVLPKVFNGNWTVYDKVGFREQDEYHDVGIVKNNEDKSYIVVLLSSNAGTANLSRLAEAIKSDIGELQ